MTGAMSFQLLCLVLISVTLSGLAQVCFKLGVSSPSVHTAMSASSPLQLLLAFATSPGVAAGLAMYGLGTLIWLHVLARADLSRVYPFVGLSFVITVVFGYLLFHEAPTPAKLVGTLLVVAGVILLGRG
jgi:drug/metabolite transporter (DMT)-like permease